MLPLGVSKPSVCLASCVCRWHRSSKFLRHLSFFLLSFASGEFDNQQPEKQRRICLLPLRQMSYFDFKSHVFD